MILYIQSHNDFNSNSDKVCLQIHWFSILNSCVTVLLLVLFLGTILMRILRSDLVKYTSEEDGGLKHHLLFSICIIPFRSTHLRQGTSVQISLNTTMFCVAGFDTEESGWKYLHGDVFRFPQMKLLFCAFIGTGSQVDWVFNGIEMEL